MIYPIVACYRWFIQKISITPMLKYFIIKVNISFSTFQHYKRKVAICASCLSLIYIITPFKKTCMHTVDCKHRIINHPLNKYRHLPKPSSPNQKTKLPALRCAMASAISRAAAFATCKALASRKFHGKKPVESLGLGKKKNWTKNARNLKEFECQ